VPNLSWSHSPNGMDSVVPLGKARSSKLALPPICWLGCTNLLSSHRIFHLLFCCLSRSWRFCCLHIMLSHYNAISDTHKKTILYCSFSTVRNKQWKIILFWVFRSPEHLPVNNSSMDWLVKSVHLRTASKFFYCCTDHGLENIADI